jgi:hypothetical protein
LILNENQCGFRQGFYTMDYIFTLYVFFLTFDSKKEKLYCAFIYFENEFDKVAIEQYQWKNVSNYTKYVQKH